MNFWVEDTSLTLGVDLDTEPDALDLTADGLGDRLLDAAQAGLAAAALAERGPDGNPWQALKASTVRAKGDGRIGYSSGAMLSALYRGEREVNPRSATWSYPRGETFVRAEAFHNGNPRTGAPARPLVGWSTAAEARARLLVRLASIGL